MTTLDDRQTDQTARLRLLENWLPLVQAENSAQQWGLSARQAEMLIITAAPSLRTARNPLTARAILWFFYQKMAREEQ